MHRRTGAIVILVTGLLIAACSGTPTPSPAASTIPSESDRDEGTEAPDTPRETPEETEADGDDDDGGGGGGAAGPVFGGSLEQAIPPVVLGEEVGVIGPFSGDQVEEELEGGGLTPEQLALIDLLGLTPADTEIAMGFSDSVIIVAIRLTGRSSEEIDAGYVEIFEAASGTGNFRVETVAGRNIYAYESLLPSNYAWVNGDILFTVSATEDGGPAAVAAMPPPTVSLTAGGGEDVARTVVELTLEGGDDEGEYQGESDEGGCSRNPFGDEDGGGFGVQFSTAEADVVFSSLQLVIDNAEAAGSGGTDEFDTTITVNDNEYRIDPAEGDGTGEVQLEDAGGDDATITISGTTDDGVTVEATVECNFVLDFGS